MDTNTEYDPLEDGEDRISKLEANADLSDQVRQIQARQDAFRDLADRFYLLWWNLPGMTTRQVDQDVRDMFRMYMDLAPSLGVSRNGIPELRECCGRKRIWKDDPISGTHPEQLLVMPKVKDEELSWCPGDIIRRVTRFFGVRYCEKCDKRRRAINAFFRCGGA